MSSNPKVHTAVIGAGLSGLASALLLSERGHDVVVLEAHDRPGGRIRSVYDEATGAYLADLGPTWIWPDFQPIIDRWVQRLDVEMFQQFRTGDAILDYGPETAPERRFLPDQDGNMRIVGGPQALSRSRNVCRDGRWCAAHLRAGGCASDGTAVLPVLRNRTAGWVGGRGTLRT